MTEENAQQEVRVKIYAGIWRRGFAQLVDGLLFAIFLVMPALFKRPVSLTPFTLLTIWLALFLYGAAMESSVMQATIGKMALGIQVTDLEGVRLSFARALARSFSKFLSNLTISIGYAIAAFTEKRQTLHDKLAGTLVTRDAARPAQIAAAGPAPATSVPSKVLVCVGVLLLAPNQIVGLASVALPSYRNALIQGQLKSALDNAKKYQDAVIEVHREGKPFSAIANDSLDGRGLATTSPFVAEINVEHGTVEIQFGSLANTFIVGKALLLIPARAEDGSLVWICGRATYPGNHLRPVISLEKLSGKTTVPVKFLPPSCRLTD